MTQYTLDELKLVYRILHGQLMNYPKLMEGQLLEDLQSHLQKLAQADGVDLSEHAAWDAWLGNESIGCDVRMAQRRVIDPQG